MKLTLNLCSLVTLALCSPAAAYASNSEGPPLVQKILLSVSVSQVRLSIQTPSSVHELESVRFQTLFIASSYSGMCKIVFLLPPL